MKPAVEVPAVAGLRRQVAEMRTQRDTAQAEHTEMRQLLEHADRQRARHVQRIEQLAAELRAATAGRAEAARLVGVQQDRALRAEAERDALAREVTGLRRTAESWQTIAELTDQVTDGELDPFDFYRAVCEQVGDR